MVHVQRNHHPRLAANPFSTPNILFPSFGKLVYAYALVLFGSSFPIATEETKLTIDTTINNWPLFFYVTLAEMLRRKLVFFVQTIIFLFWILFNPFLVIETN